MELQYRKQSRGVVCDTTDLSRVKRIPECIRFFFIPFTGYISNTATFLSPLKIARRRRRRRKWRRRDGDQLMTSDVMRVKGTRAF
jgi:hypothetical protein